MKSNIVILAIHQSHVGSKAGGYIRLKEFLKYVPKDITSIVIDWEPSIYSDEVKKSNIITIKLPAAIQFLLENVQVLGILSERLYTAFQAYYTAKKVIETYDIKVIYVPIGEFLHLYLPAVILKKTFPDVKLVVDILNFKVYKNGFITTVRASIIGSKNIYISVVTAIISYLSFTVVRRTIHNVDYVFSVSSELVETIKEIYPKKTIDYTPSGVNSSSIIRKNTKKKYLGVYMGRVTEQKGIFNVIDVWKQVVASKPNAQLAIAGLISSGIAERVNTKIQELDLQKNITIVGEVTEKEKAKIISESEIFLHLANYEPLFPVIGILEGLAGGLPAVIFDMEVTRPVIRKIETNNFLYVIENGKIEEAAAVISKIVSLDVRERVAMRKNARNYALQFDWKEITKKEFTIIRKLIHEK